ncbi:hypothetical protein Tco_0625516 [Tanacetum coccineum]|uniref:Uncharacterized protein n=1 Tax=Tanacetum coccineum TaxID=301880 RepID=A0ABQ4WH64_9ASTR
MGTVSDVITGGTEVSSSTRVYQGYLLSSSITILTPKTLGTVSDVIAGGTEGAVQHGLVRARVLKLLPKQRRNHLRILR